MFLQAIWRGLTTATGVPGPMQDQVVIQMGGKVKICAAAVSVWVAKLITNLDGGLAEPFSLDPDRNRVAALNQHETTIRAYHQPGTVEALQMEANANMPPIITRKKVTYASQRHPRNSPYPTAM